MAKVSFSKLKAKPVEEVKTITINGVEIEVRQYLPIQEKLALIGKVIELAHEQDYNYANPVKEDVFLALEMVFAYTNLSFTDKQKEDLPKLYDTILSSGVLDEILKAIPMKELADLRSGLDRTSKSLYKYQNSVLGLIDTISKDYSDLNFDLDELKKKIADPEQLSLVKDVLTKLD